MKMHFNRCVAIFLGVLWIIVSTGCAKRNEDNRPVMAVSIEPQRNILEKIAGDRFRIVTVMPGGDNPETYEASPSKRIDVEKSELYFTVGLLPFEAALKKTAAEPGKFVDTSAGIELIYGTHSHAHGGGDKQHIHVHTAADPHVWTSIRNVRKMAANMAERLKEIDSANADEYAANYEAYAAHLDSLDNAFAARVASGSASKSFLVWHPSLSYFAKDYGLEQIAVSSETKEMSISSVSGVIDRALADSVKVMFYQREYDSRQAEMVGKSVGSRLVAINPGGYDWENELKMIVDELARN